MEEARFLLPMQWGVRGIQIQNDGPRRSTMGLQEQRDQQFVDRFGRVGNLVVAFSGGRTSRRQLQPIQRAFAGQRFTAEAASSCDRRDAAGENHPQNSASFPRTELRLGAKNELQTRRESHYTLSLKGLFSSDTDYP